jgi:hypothetical protein
MKTIERLQFAILVMLQVNDAHNHEIFIDVELDEEDEAIFFKMSPAFTYHATDICRILNLTYYPEPKGDWILHTIIP